VLVGHVARQRLGHSSESALLALSSPLTAGEYLLGRCIAHRVEEASLCELTRDVLVDPVLDLIDIFITRDLGLVQFVLGDVARFVLSEPCQVLVLNPWHPFVVLTVYSGG